MSLHRSVNYLKAAQEGERFLVNSIKKAATLLSSGDQPRALQELGATRGRIRSSIMALDTYLTGNSGGYYLTEEELRDFSSMGTKTWKIKLSDGGSTILILDFEAAMNGESDRILRLVPVGTNVSSVQRWQHMHHGQ